MENPCPQQAPSAKEYQTMSNTLCGTHSEMAMASTEVWHMAHFWVSYGRCTMPGSPMGQSEGFSRR